jgi:transposase
LRAEPCKHVIAVQRTYPQAWTAYNQAQTNEGDKFQALLCDLLAGLPEPEPGRGRPRLPLRDALFASTLKVYSTFSARRFMSELREAHERGYIGKVPHFNSVLNYLDDASVTPILRGLITASALPLKAVEIDFAADSSGFTTNKFHRWFDRKYGVERQGHDWVKVHIMCGVKTNIVTAIEIAGRNASDAHQLPALVNATAQHFPIGEVSADKGYASKANIEAVQRVGGTPYIAFRTSDTGWRGGAWAKALGYFLAHRDAFLQHYHKRSNVESTFSMIKRRFGDALRSKAETAMVNEALCKILCHNLVVLIHEMYELGIDPGFWAGTPLAQQGRV